MSVYRLASIFVFIFILVPWCVYAEDQSLGEITVEAPNSEIQEHQASLDTTTFSQVITSKDFEGRKTSVPEVLEQTAGVQIRRFGGLEDFATVSIRGSTSEQVAVFLDGIPLNEGANGTVNLATLPIEQIERIEVYQGNAPASFGTSAVGGVINILTKRAQEKRQTSLTQSFGSFTTYEATLLQSDTVGDANYSLGYTFGRSTGDFGFFNDNGTPFNPNDDFDDKRQNNEFARHNAIAKIGYALNDTWSLGFQNQFFREDRGVPGFSSNQTQDTDLSTTREGVAFDITRKSDVTMFKISPSFQFLKEQFADPSGEVGFGTQDTDNTTLQYGTNFQASRLIGSHQKVLGLVEYRGEQFLPKDFSQSPSSQAKSVRNRVGISVEDELSFLSEKILLNPSVRTEHVFNDFAAASSSFHPVSGKVGLQYRPLENLNTLAFKTNAARAYRIPNFSELFGDQGNILGNPNLNPEDSWNFDAGVQTSHPRFRAQTAYFLRFTNNLIQPLQTSQFTIQSRNLNEARVQGVETSVSVDPFSFLSLHANYTFQLARDTSGNAGTDGKFLPGRPVHEASGRVVGTYRWVKTFSDLTFMDRNFLDTQNILEVRNRFLWNAGFSLNPYKKWTASFETKNILNNRVSDIVGFPLPERSFYGKLEIKI